MGKFNLLTTLSLNASGLSEGLKKSVKDVEDYVNATQGKNSKLSYSFRDVAQMGVGEMRKELMKLRNVSFAGKTQQEIAIINNRIGELVDTMGDLKAQQKALGSEFGSVLAGGLQTVAALGEVGVGAAQMFGVTKDEAEKYQRVMVTLIGTTQALGTIQNAIETKQLQVIGLKIKAMASQASATVSATVAQLGLNTAMSASLYGAIALAVVGLAAGITYMVNAENEATEAARKHYEEIKRLNERSLERKKIINDTAEEAVKSFAKQQIYVDRLVRSVESEKTTLKEKKKAIAELIALDPEYLKGLNLQNVATDEGKRLIGLYVEALKRKAMAEAAASQLSELYLKQFKKEQQIKEALIGQEVLLIQRAELEKRMQKTSDFGLSVELGKQYAENNKKLERMGELIGDLDTIGTGRLYEDMAEIGKEITAMTSLLDKNTVAVEFNSTSQNKNTNTLKDKKKAYDDLFASMISVVQYEYNVPTMTPLSPPAANKLQLGNDAAGDTVPTFNYDETIASADALNERIDKSRELASLATDSILMLGDALGQAAATGEVSFQGMVVSILSGIRQVISAKLAEAIAGMIAGESSKGLPGLILAGIGIAGITSLFASLPKFEYGGIAPGTSFSGDKVLARVNSKEMILTQRQQAQLFALANGANGGSDSSEVTFRIEGDCLVGVLNKYAKKQKTITGR